MSTELSGIQAFSFYDPATGDTVQVDQKYVESFNFTQERGAAAASTSPTGADVGGGDRSELEVTFTTMAGTPLLEQWNADDTPISFVAAGEQAAIQWYETDRITELESLPVFEEHGDLSRYRALLVREGHGTHDIYEGTNLLRPVNHGIGSTYLKDSWQDSDSDSVADGYGVFGTGSASDFTASDVQQLTTPSNGDTINFRPSIGIAFPIEGIECTLRSNITNTNSGGDDKVVLSFQDFGGTIAQVTKTTFTSGGIKTVIDTSPASTYKIFPYPYRSVNSTTGDLASLKLPALRLDGGTSYVEY